jgi:hypothetical protein
MSLVNQSIIKHKMGLLHLARWLTALERIGRRLVGLLDEAESPLCVSQRLI